jgi:hypothetical protein
MAPVALSEFTRIRKFSVGASHGHKIPFVGKVFLGSVCFNVLIILAYRIAVLIQLMNVGVADTNYNTDHIWFFCLTLETAAFMMYFAMDSIHTENHYELIAFVVCAFILGLRSVLEYASRDPEAGDMCTDDTGLGSFCVASTFTQCAFTVFYIVIAPSVWKSYGWRFYKVVGSDAKLRQMWLHYQQYLSLKFLDISFTVLVLTTGVIYLASSVYGSIISAVCLIVELFWMRLGTVAYERENDNAMRIWMVLSVLFPLYIVFFVLVAMQAPIAHATGSGVSNATVGAATNNTEYAAAMENPIIVTKMCILAALALINRVASVIWAYTGWSMFNHGMLERVFPRMLRGAGETIAASRSNNGARVVVDDSNPQKTGHGRGPSVFHDQGAQNYSNKL